MSLDGLSLSRLTTELSTHLLGGRVEKIFQPDANSIILFVRQPGETIRLLINIAAKYPRLQIIATSPPNPLQAPTFCMLLRKHLDAHSEQAVTSALDEAMRSRTTLFIAHRLTTIQNADQILLGSSTRFLVMRTAR